MSRIVVVSSANHARIRHAKAWLDSRTAGEEMLNIGVGATPDAANEFARKVVKRKAAAFGWHRLTVPGSL